MDARTWTGVLVAGTAVAVLTLSAPHADAGTPARGDAAVASAVAALTTDEAPDISVVPAGFVDRFGYRPRVVDGMVVNPHGACSSPVPLPAEFDTACKAHDYGYDLLRYAHAAGADLGPWARTALDEQLDRRMHAACDARGIGRASCFVMANSAAAAVSINSQRQGYGAPIDEPWIRYGLVAALTALGGWAVAVTVRRVRRGAGRAAE
ncbi:hypothetical protein [Prescottella subtropica]|uniref:hypothetical protein n=1 Tax=Prescottella subtropica TaxID=2545757 RepID=UPI0010FA3390|nr:hypothetical protein [Prescottella subtropica]